MVAENPTGRAPRSYVLAEIRIQELKPLIRGGAVLDRTGPGENAIHTSYPFVP